MGPHVSASMVADVESSISSNKYLRLLSKHSMHATTMRVNLHKCDVEAQAMQLTGSKNVAKPDRSLQLPFACVGFSSALHS